MPSHWILLTKSPMSKLRDYLNYLLSLLSLDLNSSQTLFYKAFTLKTWEVSKFGKPCFGGLREVKKEFFWHIFNLSVLLYICIPNLNYGFLNNITLEIFIFLFYILKKAFMFILMAFTFRRCCAIFILVSFK